MKNDVKKWFEVFEENARKGLYQLSDDIFHYNCVGTDKDGLKLFRSELGTNKNENLHQKYADLVGAFAIGIRVGHILTALRSYRYNISVGISFLGEPDFGTDHHMLVDELQNNILTIFGVFAWPAHKNLLNFNAGKLENFISVGVGPIPHEGKIIKTGQPKEGISQDYTYISQVDSPES